MPLPNTILIGVQKAGTSSLYDWISQHPEVCGNISVKDFPFFINDKFYKNGLNYLSDIFSSYYNGEKIIIHGNVQYFFNSKSFERIKKDIPNPKFILILRNPVDRLFSAFNYFKKMQLENEKDLITASIKLRNERENSDDFVIRNGLTYIEHGLYAKQLKEFFKYFNSEQLHICFFDDLIDNNQHILKDLYSFLEINNSYMPKIRSMNQTGKVKSELLQKLFFKKNKIRKFLVDNFLDLLIPLHKRTELRWKIKELNTENKKNNKYHLSITDRKELLRYFIDDIRELEKMLKIDLSSWKK